MIAVEDLLGVGIFKDFPTESLEGIIARLQEKSFPEGARILSRGDPGHSMFMILNGSVAVTHGNEEGAEYTITTLGNGEIFGEMALLAGEPRSANVRALSDVRVAELNQEDLRELISVFPKLNEALLRLVAQRCTRSFALQRFTICEREEIISNLSAHQLPDVGHFVGRSRATEEINATIEHLASTEANIILISGERGTGKLLAAHLIHLQGAGGRRPLFHLDCSHPLPILRDETAATDAREDSLHLEPAQESALFGYGADTESSAKSIRRGLMELADGGSVILEKIDLLSPGIQRLLVQYCRSPSFQPRGAGRPISGRVRLIATSSRTLEELSDQRILDPELLALLSGQTLSIKPLRARKKDIPVLAEHFLGEFNKKYSRRISGFSEEAVNLLVNYDWPLNVDELQQVIERAVVSTSGDTITSSQVFLKLNSFADSGRFNLFELPLLRKVLTRPGIPADLRFITLPFILMLIAFTIAGPVRNNPANLIVWTLWEPLLILSVFFAGRSWCACCPLPVIGEWVCGSRKRFLQVPELLTSYGPWIAIGGLIVIIQSEHLFDMFTKAHGTGVLLLVILACAVVTTLLFGRRAWCRHLCPLGMMISQYTAVSLVELGANNDVCASHCSSHDCVKEGNCPMGLHPATEIGSKECVFCLSCVRMCKHGAARVNGRMPRLDELRKGGEEPSDAFFAVFVVASVLAVKLTDSGILRGFSAGRSIWNQGLWAALAQYIVITMFFSGLVILVSRLAFTGEKKRDYWLGGYAYICLALSALLNTYLHELIYESHLLPSSLVHVAGFGALNTPDWLTPNLATLKILPPAITLTGGACSLALLKRLAGKYGFSAASYRAHQAIMFLVMMLFLII